MILSRPYRRRKGNSTAKLLIWLAFLIVVVLAGRLLILRDDKIDLGGQTGKATSSAATGTASTTWSKLRDRAGTFEVSYPKKILKQTEKKTGVPPAGKETVKAQVLYHAIPVEHCGLSGLPEHCTASTTDFSLSFFVVDRSFNDIFASLKEIYGELPVATWDGHQGVVFEQGAEGEGIIYTALPVNDAKTLFIARSYINEEVVGKYKTAKDFIKFADQQVLFEQIMATFRFRPAF